MWVDEGNDPAYDKLRGCGATDVYRSLRDPRTSRQALAADRAQGFGLGVYFAATWWPTLTATQLADLTSGMLTAIADKTDPTNPKVCADIETHSVPFVLEFLARWRAHRPRRVTDWTLEGYQGGLFSPADVLAITRANVGVVVQLYNGAMEPLDQFDAALDLVQRGFPWRVLSGFFDAAALPGEWSGYAFTQGRLP